MVAQRVDLDGASNRRAVAVAAAVLLAVGAVTAILTGVPAVSSQSVCGPGAYLMVGLPGPTACAHSDEAPPGVDVTDHVSTADLAAREGAGAAAYEAAQDLGVPSSPAAGASNPQVPCDGDGTSGYRVQAMYVVEAGKPNRYTSLLDSMKLWAAGADDVINRSAALTGGVRHLRYVTDASGGTCTAKVLNVTVPAGSMASFNATISAVQGLGYTDPTRKYLMWTDASVLCGIATMYTTDSDGQSNPNNGYYAQYARVDSGCWGLGNGSGEHSVEAHELTHTLGGVQSSAPHGTRAGHCWDESDTMCYADGGGFAMRQVCPPEREYLLDCNTDDYFSTFPDPGSYLDTHWNAADSRFLIGGGDGTGGGTAGAPTVLGATIGVNNPAVPGLSTQVSVTPVLPAGRTVSSVAWKSARSDCTFSAPTELQSDVTCAATASGSTTVTVTLKDSTGAAKTLTSPLTFATGTARPVTVDLGAAGQSGSSVSACTGAAFPVAATVTDTASGLPVKGLSVTFTKKTPTMTAPAGAGAATTTVSGTSTISGTATVTTTYAAKTLAGTVYGAGTSGSVSAVPAKCSPTLTGTTDKDELYYGEPVTASGTLTRDAGGVAVPVAGASLPVTLSYRSGTTTRVVTLGSARTAADGTWTLAVKPTLDGTLAVALPGSASYAATSVSLGDVVVHLPTTDLTAALDRTDVGYGDTVTVTGRLTKTAGATTTGVGSATLTVKEAAPGKIAVQVATGRTLADGTYSVAVPLRSAGSLQIAYAGAAGVPADSVALGDVTVGTWTTAVSLTGAKSGTLATLNGSVAGTYQGKTAPAKSVRVKLYFTPTSTGVPTLVSSPTTSTSGTFTARLTSTVAGSYQAVVSGVVGYADASSGTVPVS